MFERFTQGAIKSVMLAQVEALRLGLHHLDTEQLLLGLIAEQQGIASKSLRRSGVELTPARAAVATRVSKQSSSTQLPWYSRWKCFFIPKDNAVTFDPRLKRVFELAYEESEALNRSFVGTAQLLLGLLREAEENTSIDDTGHVAFQVLLELGVAPTALRAIIFDEIERLE